MKVFRDWTSLSALLRAIDADGEPKRVLVVEDETMLREGLQRQLSALGHEVDAREGAERADLPFENFDIAFLDNYFISDSLTGVALAPELRRSCPQIRIVAMSSDAGKNAEMLRLGANLAVPKATLRQLVR